MKLFRPLALLLVATAAASMLSGCTTAVTLDPAEDANNPACAEIIARLPEDIDGMQRRATNAQSTGAWGEPAAVLLRCGLPLVEASTLKCLTVGGVDWLIDPEKSPSYRFITFGRKPATEIIINSESASGANVLDALSPLMTFLPATRSCQLPD